MLFEMGNADIDSMDNDTRTLVLERLGSQEAYAA